MGNESSDHVFETAGYQVHHWAGLGERDVVVLHKEPFRFAWFATKLVTYVFLIRRSVETVQQIRDDYPALRAFAGEHKRTLLPFAFQCGYALLPVYVSETFPDALTEAIRSTYKKRWCVFHVPSLLEVGTGRLHSLERKSFWGCVYRRYIQATVDEVANVVLSQHGPSG